LSTQPRLKKSNGPDSPGFFRKDFAHFIDQCKPQMTPRRGYHTSDTDAIRHYTARAVESGGYSQYTIHIYKEPVRSQLWNTGGKYIGRRRTEIEY
jgi:hypothetical protein